MTKAIDTWCDPLRTIDACRLDGVVHITTLVDEQLRTLCGLDIDQGELLILRQRPQDITCQNCKDLLTNVANSSII